MNDFKERIVYKDTTGVKVANSKGSRKRKRGFAESRKCSETPCIPGKYNRAKVNQALGKPIKGDEKTIRGPEER